MDVNNGLFIFSIIEHLLSVGFCFYVDTTPRSFEIAKTSCKLAKPSIHFSSRGMTLDIDPIDGLQVNETAWVGYTQNYEIFRYFGCVNYSLVQRPKEYSTLIQRNIGECQSFCKTSQYIGVKALESGGAFCECINVTNPNFRSWLTSCGDDRTSSEFPFGGPYKLSIFQTVSTNVKKLLEKRNFWSDTSRNCLELVLSPQSNIYQWGSCSVSQKVICVGKNNSQIWKPLLNNYHSWKKTTERCLGINRVLMPYQEDNNIHDVFNPVYWTSNVRDYVTSNISARPSTTQQYGYIHRQTEDYFELHFDQSDQPRKSLCEDIQGSSRPIVTIPSTDSVTGSTFSESNGISSDTTPNSKSPKSSSEPTSESSSKSSFSDSSGESTSEASFSNSSRESSSRDTEKAADSNIALFVSIPVVIVLLICGVVVAVVFWRRRANTKKQTTDVNQNNNTLTYSVQTGKAQQKANGSENYNDIASVHMAHITEEFEENYHEITDIDEPVQEDYDTINDLSESEPTRNSINNHSYFVLERVPNGKHGEDSSSDHYNYAREPNASGALEQGHAYHVLEKTDNTDTKTPGYSYATVMKRVEPRLQGNEYDNNTIDNRENDCATNEDRDYDHLNHGNETKQTNKRLQGNGNDDDENHVYNKSLSPADTYDHLNNESCGTNGLRRGNIKEYGDKTNVYNKLKIVGSDNDDMYNHIDNGNGGTTGLNGENVAESSHQTNIYNKLKVGHEDDDMYNHVNNAQNYNLPNVQTGKHTIPDNPYDHTK